MSGMLAVAAKEFSDHVGSKRFWLFFLIIYLAGVLTAEIGLQAISAAGSEHAFLLVFTASNGNFPPFLFFVSFIGPLLGIALGFDAVNTEFNKGTLVRLLSQPLHRDAVINGKFLAGLLVIACTLLGLIGVASGLVIRVGLAPTAEETARLFVFAVLSIVYLGLWMSIALLFSILFRSTATSALASIAVWAFFAFFWAAVVGVITNAIIPSGTSYDPNVALNQLNLQLAISRVSPMVLFQEATYTLLTPTVRFLNPVGLSDLQYVIANPLPLGQSLILIWQHLTGLAAAFFLIFFLAYVRFLKQDVRA